MLSITGDGMGRVIVINLKRGELLLESIEEELEKLGVKDAIITGAIGSLKKAVFHRVTGMGREPEDEFITIEKPMELASLQGIVANGRAHFHMVTSDLEATYTGHLEPGTEVLYLVEISLVEIKGLPLVREKNADNIATLKPRT